MSDFTNWNKEEISQRERDEGRFGEDPAIALRDHKKRTEISETKECVRVGDEYYTIKAYDKIVKDMEDHAIKLRKWVEETPKIIREARAAHGGDDFNVEKELEYIKKHFGEAK